MAITFPAAYSSVQGDGGNNGLAITTGTETEADDVLVVGMCVNGNADTITPPGGWTEATVGDNSIATTGGQIRAWYLVDPADSTTYTWTVGTSTRRSIVGVLCRGVDNTTPIDVKGSNQSGPGTNHTPPSLTSTVDNVGVVDIIGLRQFSPDTANWTVPASGLTWTEQKDVQGADSNNNIRLALGTAVAGAAGALSTAVWTQSDVFEDSIDIRIALKPAAGGGTDATVTPSTVAAVASVPSATVSTGSTVTPAVVAAVAAVPTATVSTGSTVTPGSVAAVAAVPTATVSTGSTVTASTVAAVAAVPAASISAGSTVLAVTVQAVAAVPAATVATGSTVTAVTVAAVAAVPTPNVTAGGATIAAATVAAVAAVNSPTVSAGSTVLPSTVVAVASIPAPTVVVPAAGMTGLMHGTELVGGAVTHHAVALAGGVT